MTEESPTGRAQWGVVLVFAIGLLMLVAWAMRSLPTASPLLAQTVFPDGTRLDVMGVSKGERTVDFKGNGGFLRWLRGTIFARWLGVPGMAGSAGSSTYQLSDFTVECFGSGSSPLRCRIWDNRSTSAMLLEIRTRNADGSPKVMPAYFNGDDAVFDDKRLGSKTSYRPFSASTGSPDAWDQALTAADMQLLVQWRDPQMGWIHLAGPYLFNEAEKDRYILVLPAWQRDLPSLDFRAIQTNGSIVNFSVPNPDFTQALVRPPAVPMPAVHTAVDFSFTLRRVDRQFTAGSHPFTWFETTLESGGKPVGKDGLWPLRLSVEGSSVEDEWGNKAHLRWDTVTGNQRGVGVRLPAAARHLSLSFLVERTASYPRKEAEGVLILEGVVRADGKNVDFTLLSDAVKFGITKAPVGNLKPISLDRDDPRKDWLSVKYEVQCVVGPTERESLTRNFGEVGGWQFLAIPGDAVESAGQPVGYGIGGKTSPSLDLKTSRCWNAPPEMLRAGARFRIGIFRPLASETVNFEIEAPPLPTQAK